MACPTRNTRQRGQMKVVALLFIGRAERYELQTTGNDGSYAGTPRWRLHGSSLYTRPGGRQIPSIPGRNEPAMEVTSCFAGQSGISLMSVAQLSIDLYEERT